MTAQELCALHRSISVSERDRDGKKELKEALCDYLDSPDRPFANIYRLHSRRLRERKEIGMLSKSFIGDLLPELKSINMAGYAVRDTDVGEDYIELEAFMPWGGVTVCLRLQPSACCVTGDFPYPDPLNKWLLLEARDIKFLSNYIPEQLRLGMVYELAKDHGWEDRAWHDTQVLLTSDK